MPTFEFLGTYQLTDQPPLHLIKNMETQESMLIANEWARLLGYYRSIKWSPTSNGYRMLLARQELRDFKQFLHRQNIFAYRRSTRLSLLTETGLAYWLGITRYEPMLRLAGWLFQQVLPRQRAYTKPLYVQNVRCESLQNNLHIWIYQGRIGVLEPDLHAILTEQTLDHVSLVCACYVQHVHFDILPLDFYQTAGIDHPTAQNSTPSPIYFLYESGIYRYLHHHRDNPRSEIFLRAWEQEILPTLHHPDYWSAIEGVSLVETQFAPPWENPQAMREPTQAIRHPTKTIQEPTQAMRESDQMLQAPSWLGEAAASVVPVSSPESPTAYTKAAETPSSWQPPPHTLSNPVAPILSSLQQIRSDLHIFSQQIYHALTQLMHGHDLVCEHLWRQQDMMKSGFTELESLIRKNHLALLLQRQDKTNAEASPLLPNTIASQSPPDQRTIEKKHTVENKIENKTLGQSSPDPSTTEKKTTIANKSTEKLPPDPSTTEKKNTATNQSPSPSQPSQPSATSQSPQQKQEVRQPQSVSSSAPTNLATTAPAASTSHAVESHHISNVQPISVEHLKNLAIALGFYYLDRCSPHLALVRALIIAAQSDDLATLQQFVAKNYKLVEQNNNTIPIGGISYGVWKRKLN